MNGFQFLLHAEHMLRDHAHPAGHRSAVSRAYYAAHHCIKDFVKEAGVSIKRGPDAHADVWNHLADTGDDEIEQVGSDLSDLRGDRNDADYDLADPRTERADNAAALVAQARSLIEAVNMCRSDARRYSQIKKAIQARNSVLRGAAAPRPNAGN